MMYYKTKHGKMEDEQAARERSWQEAKQKAVTYEEYCADRQRRESAVDIGESTAE